MNIFLSHAVIDKAIAEKIKKLMFNVSLGFIDPWLSSSLDGLKPGDVVWDELHEQLKNADRIITILTPNSYLRPWLLYESGYVAGSKKSPIIPLVCGLTKDDLPKPLSSYVIYSADNLEDICRLLFQLVSDVVPNPNKEFIESQSSKLIDEIPSLLTVHTPHQNENSHQNYLNELNIRFIEKLKASEILHRKLADEQVNNITIITYTNEVEANAINHYRIKGKKNIIVFKRSIMSDLSEEQKYNILRIRDGSQVRFWNKSKISIRASNELENEFQDNSDVKISQYFYDFPPSKRAYIFDENEAIIAYYEHVEDILCVGGSMYKGMNNSKSLHVTNKSEIGNYLIQDLIHYTKNLKPLCRTWEQEKKSIESLPDWFVGIKSPCINPKAVFLDMDGVLYDSLPQYVEAWQKAFNNIGVTFPKIEVYRKEGMPGRQTVTTTLKSMGITNFSEEKIDMVLDKKAEVLGKLGRPKIQFGAKELVTEIAKSGLEMWVVTGSTRPDIVNQITEDFTGLIPAKNIITGNDYEIGKPNPAPYLMAAQKSGIDPRQAIVIENAPLGVESAKRCGAYCIAVNTGILDAKELQTNGARVVFIDCKQLSEKWHKIINIFKME